jgi:hypothetical protein
MNIYTISIFIQSLIYKKITYMHIYVDIYIYTYLDICKYMPHPDGAVSYVIDVEN